MTSRFQNFPCAVLLILLMGQPGLAEEPQSAPRIPPPVEEVLRWFPEDTDTLLVARSFKMPIKREWMENPPADIDLSEIATRTLQHFATGPLFRPREEWSPKTFGSKLAEPKVAWAVHGARYYEVISPFGGYRYQGCHVLLFEEELGERRRGFVQALRKNAAEVKQFAGRNIYVFDWEFPKEPYIRTRDWEGLFVVEPKEKMLLYGTNEAYVRQLLERHEQQPRERNALPDTLPEWGHVDLRAPAWAVRHPHERRRGRRQAAVPAGSDFSLSLKPAGKDLLEIVYTGSDDDRLEEFVRRRWIEPELFQQLRKLGLAREPRSDGAMAVVLPLPNTDNHGAFIMKLWLHQVLADELILRKE